MSRRLRGTVCSIALALMVGCSGEGSAPTAAPTPSHLLPTVPAATSSASAEQVAASWPAPRALPKAQQTRVWSVFETKDKVLVWDDAETSRTPKRRSAPNLAVLIAHGIAANGWLVEPTQITPAAPFTLLTSEGACVTTAKQSWLFGAPTSTTTRWHELRALADCRPGRYATTAAVYWRSFAVEGAHPQGRLGMQESLSEIEAGLWSARLRRQLTSPDNPYRAFADELDATTFERFGDVPDLVVTRTMRGASSGAPPEVASLMRVWLHETVVGTLENDSANAALVVSGRTLLLLERDRLVEVTTGGLLDAGTLAGRVAPPAPP